MPALKLAKLPDRKPVRITIKIDPDLNRSLERYAEAYNAVYGEDERLAVLIPHILESFLTSDRDFAKSTKAKAGESRPSKPESKLRRYSASTHTSSTEGAS